MNGRIYDPLLGQFMQPDNFIQTPEDYLGYDRYTYCCGNPFKWVDPSGERYDDSGFWQSMSANTDFNRFVETFNRVFDAYQARCDAMFASYNAKVKAANDEATDEGNSDSGGGRSGGYAYGGKTDDNDGDDEDANIEAGAKGKGKKKGTKEGDVIEKGGESLYAIGVGSNAVGFVSSAGEYSNVINGSWRGINGKWYSLEWGGNQWTGARANALSKASYFKLASRGLFVVGTGISLYQGGDALLKGNYDDAAKFGLDIGMGALATFGGPIGWGIGGGYFVLDVFGAFDFPMITIPYSLPMYAVPDNTYVAPPVIFPLR